MIELKRFEEEVFQSLQNLPSPSAVPVCKWTEPEGKILPKTEKDLMMDVGSQGKICLINIANRSLSLCFCLRHLLFVCMPILSLPIVNHKI